MVLTGFSLAHPLGYITIASLQLTWAFMGDTFQTDRIAKYSNQANIKIQLFWKDGWIFVK